MIPGRIKHILNTSMVACAIVALCFIPYDLKASLVYTATSAWVILNFLVWAIILGSVIRPADAPANPLGLVIGLLAKFALFGAGIAALVFFAPYTHIQLYAMILGVSSVLIVAFFKALGSHFASRTGARETVIRKDRAAKV